MGTDHTERAAAPPQGTPRFTRENVDRFRVRPLKESRSVVGPDVWLLECDGERFVLKDFRHRAWLFRNTWGRIAVSRETAAYGLLAGVPGVPRLAARLDPFGFVMEFKEGSILPPRSGRAELGMEFFDALNDVVGVMHDRGVAHGDLRRKNILVDAQRRPVLLDFETATIRRDRWFSRRFFRMIQRVDRLKVLKIKHKYFTLRSTPEEIAQLENPPWYLRAGRFLRRSLYAPIKARRREEDEDD